MRGARDGGRQMVPVRQTYGRKTLAQGTNPGINSSEIRNSRPSRVGGTQTASRGSSPSDRGSVYACVQTGSDPGRLAVGTGDGHRQMQRRFSCHPTTVVRRAMLLGVANSNCRLFSLGALTGDATFDFRVRVRQGRRAVRVLHRRRCDVCGRDIVHRAFPDAGAVQRRCDEDDLRRPGQRAAAR